MKSAVFLISVAFFGCAASLPRKAYEGRWNEVRAEIEQGADPNAVLETSGHSILYFASEQGSLEMVRFLLSRGVKPDERSPSGETPLYGAVDSCHPDIAGLLLASGADPRKPDSFHGTTMHAAARNCPELIGLLASRGISVNLENPASNELTPLMAAAASGNVRSVQELLRLGADIHRRNRDNQNAFDYVFHLKNSQILILLLRNGATPVLNEKEHVLSFWGVDSFENLQALLDRQLITPAQALHAVVAASFRGRDANEGQIQSREEIIRLLVKSGVPLSTRGKEGRTVLMTALESAASMDFLKFLIQEGAPVSGQDSKEQSALSLAANAYEEAIFSTGFEQAERVLELIAAEAAGQKGLSQSERLLLALVQKDRASLKSILNSYRFQNQDTAQIALVYAAAHHGPETVLALLESGAQPNRPQSEGTLCCLRPTALIAAAKYGQTANVRLLLAKGARAGDRFGCCGGGIGALDAAKDVEIRTMLQAAGN